MLIKSCSSLIMAAAIMTSFPLSASAESSNSALEQGGVIVGGTIQHSDPTRYDYAPEKHPESINLMSAKGYAPVSAFNYTLGGVNIHVPSSSIFHAIDGKGTHIDYERATYTAPAQICNYRFDYQNRDLNGNIIRTWSNGTRQGCLIGMAGDTGIRNKNVSPGMMCAKLYTSGAFRGEQCHHIH